MKENKITIKLNNVSKKYINDINVLNDINLTINSGDFVSIIGPSGCGKSTLLNIIAGLDTPSTGTVSHNEKTINKLSDNELAKYRAHNIGFVFQFFNLLPSLTLWENIGLPLEIINSKEDKHKLISTALQNVGMENFANYFPQELSGGQMQRIAIARALIHRPQIIIADEPTGNLDSQNGKNILELLIKANQELKSTLILVTHDNSVASYSKTIIRIKDGQILGQN